MKLTSFLMVCIRGSARALPTGCRPCLTLSLVLSAPVTLFGQWSTVTGGISYSGGSAGIGPSAMPLSAKFNVADDMASSVYVTVAGGQTAGLWLRSSLATIIAPGQLNAPQRLGGVFGAGFTGAAYQPAAAVTFFADEPFTPGTTGSRIHFETTTLGTSARVERMRIDSAGRVGIGTTTPRYLLSVNGTIGAKEVLITGTGWSDYVFRKQYRLRPLDEVKAYIDKQHHLPGIPSEQEVKEKGVGLAEMQAKLLAKIEELTLHLIHQADENRELRARVARLEKAQIDR